MCSLNLNLRVVAKEVGKCGQLNAHRLRPLARKQTNLERRRRTSAPIMSILRSARQFLSLECHQTSKRA